MESPPLLDDFPERPWISMLFCRTSIWTGWQCCRVWQALWQGNHGILVRVQLTLAEVFDNMYGWGPEHGVSFPPNLTIESIGKWGLISGFGGTVASLSDKAYELSWQSLWVVVRVLRNLNWPIDPYSGKPIPIIPEMLPPHWYQSLVGKSSNPGYHCVAVVWRWLATFGKIW